MPNLRKKIEDLKEKLAKINKEMDKVDELVSQIYESKELSGLEDELDKL